MLRDFTPALVSMDSAPLDDLLMEVGPRMLKQDLDGCIHVMFLDDLHFTSGKYTPNCMVYLYLESKH